MQIRAFVATDTGRVRKQNEDSFGVDESLGLFVVCDGMGGHAAGDVASKTAVNAIVRVLGAQRAAITRCDGGPASLEAMAALLETAVQEASRAIHTLAGSERGKHGMGTTCVALLVLGDKAMMANVGDSRLYLARDGKLHQLSTDHDFATEIVGRGMMTREQAARSPHASALTRAVGVQPTVAVELLTFDVLAGDTFLLCSDGVHHYAADAAALAALLAEADAAAIARRLVLQALEGGGHDNATALVVRVESDDVRQLERKTLIEHSLDALREIELFRELSMAELVKIYGLFREQHVGPGATPIREGQGGDQLYVIVTGRFDVHRAGKHVATLGRGAHFGEMALLNQRARSATLTALEPARLLELARPDFESLRAREPVVAAKFLWKLAQTLSLRLDDAYLARDFRSGRNTLGLGEYPSPVAPPNERRPKRR